MMPCPAPDPDPEAWKWLHESKRKMQQDGAGEAEKRIRDGRSEDHGRNLGRESIRPVVNLTYEIGHISKRENGNSAAKYQRERSISCR